MEPMDFYDETVVQSTSSDDKIKEFLKENSISLTGDANISLVLDFSQLNLPDYLKKKLKNLGFTRPTPIQSLAWPIALGGNDLIGIAQTGSGKTLSFILPALIHIQGQKTDSFRDGPSVLVMCPTRELVMQCRQVVNQVVGHHIRTACVYGGSSRNAQIRDINSGCQLVIATPGRLLDFIQCREISLRNCTYLVLDEADRMLDMGFEKDIRTIVKQIRPDRQFTMWSATWPKDIRNLAKSLLQSSSGDGHVHIKVGSAELQANTNVQQNFEIFHSKDKMKGFLRIMKQLMADEDGNSLGKKTIVFVNTKRSCSFVARGMRQVNIDADLINGDISQRGRDHVMHWFKHGTDRVLVATEVAARGLDVSDIDYVVNFDLPPNCVDYIHRIGRTGRAGRKGAAYSLLTELDGAILDDLIKNLQNIGHEVDEKLIQMREWYRKNKSAQSRGGEYRNQHRRGYNDNRGYSRGGGYDDQYVGRRERGDYYTRNNAGFNTNRTDRYENRRSSNYQQRRDKFRDQEEDDRLF